MNGQGISADPWADVINEQQQERERSRYEQMRGAQEADYAEMGEVVRRNAMENAKRQMSFNNLLASAVKFSNGGALPEVVRNYMNRKMGFDGVRTGVLGGGYQQDGSYAFEIANGADGQGNVARQTQAFSPSSLYNMMNMNRVAFDDADRASMRQKLLSSGLSEKEVETMDAAGRVYGRVADPQHISNMMTAGGGAGGRQIGGTAVMKRVDRRPHAVRAYSNVQTPGRTAGGRVFGAEADGTPFAYELGEEKPEAANWHQFSVGPSDDGKTQVRGYKNEVSGEVVYVKDGETPPWRQGGKSRGLSLDDRIALEREKTAGRKEIEGMKGETRLKVADIQKALKERGLDISEDKITELIRHNKATESAAGAKQSGGGFNKTIYERYVSEMKRLEEKGSARTEEDDKELERIRNKISVMEGDAPEAEKPEGWAQTFQGGDTQGGGAAKPGAKNPPAAKQPAPAKAAGANAEQPSEETEKPSKEEAAEELARRTVMRAEEGNDEENIRNAAHASEQANANKTEKPAAGDQTASASAAQQTAKKPEKKRKSFSDIYDEKRPKNRSIHDLRNDYSKIADKLRDSGNTGTELYDSLNRLNFFDSNKIEAKDIVASRKIIDKWSKQYKVMPDWMSSESQNNAKWDDATESEFRKYFAELQRSDKPIYKGISENEARRMFDTDRNSFWRTLFWRDFRNNANKRFEETARLMKEAKERQGQKK